MTMIAQERLYLTRDRKTLVGDGDKRAAELYATPGTEIPESAAKLFGLTDGRLGKGRAPVGEDQGAGATGGGKEKERQRGAWGKGGPGRVEVDVSRRLKKEKN